MEVSVEFWGSTPGHPPAEPPVDLCVSSFPDNQRREAALLGVPGARNLLCRSTRGTKPTLPEYQGHETYSKPSFGNVGLRRGRAPPVRFPSPRGAPDGPFRRCPEPPVVLFDARFPVAHLTLPLTDWQPRPAIGGPRRPASRWCSGGRFLRPAGRPPWPGGPRAEGPANPSAFLPGERSVARPRRPSAPAVLPRSPRPGRPPLPREEGGDAARRTPRASGKHVVSQTLTRGSGGPPHRVGRTASLGARLGGRPQCKVGLRPPGRCHPGLPG
ncbi:hypothetical protein Q5P01_000974 [Channa striata]|uniref:Uncharacterized protein n=1 Tax=Channa striata TaxID=64152 RepID=A0AA88IJF0_CHASR|nr:hypothetical protein Q5P01_000974 [Channa striata]